jgi:beta-galactosidase/beta-glucuronidase
MDSKGKSTYTVSFAIASKWEGPQAMTVLKISPVSNTARRPIFTSTNSSKRPRVQGKFIFAGDKKLYIRGVTYGPFCPDQDGNKYHNPGVVERDFAQIAANGLNAVRTYTVPPRWLLDIAQRHGLRVMVGLPMERQAMFLDDRKHARSLEEWVRAEVRACAGHPAVLCYTIGNEIRASIVRWHNSRRVERCLE